MIRLLRRLGLLRRPAVSREEALAIARRECEVRGWSWNEPVLVEEGLSTYVVRTNMAMRGGNATIHVAADTGEVVSAVLPSR